MEIRLWKSFYFLATSNVPYIQATNFLVFFAYPVLLRSNIDGKNDRRYVHVQMNSKITDNRLWKLNRALCDTRHSEAKWKQNNKIVIISRISIICRECDGDYMTDGQFPKILPLWFVVFTMVHEWRVNKWSRSGLFATNSFDYNADCPVNSWNIYLVFPRTTIMNVQALVFDIFRRKN